MGRRSSKKLTYTPPSTALVRSLQTLAAKGWFDEGWYTFEDIAKVLRRVLEIKRTLKEKLNSEFISRMIRNDHTTKDVVQDRDNDTGIFTDFDGRTLSKCMYLCSRGSYPPPVPLGSKWYESLRELEDGWDIGGGKIFEDSELKCLLEKELSKFNPRTPHSLLRSSCDCGFFNSMIPRTDSNGNQILKCLRNTNSTPFASSR